MTFLPIFTRQTGKKAAGVCASFLFFTVVSLWETYIGGALLQADVLAMTATVTLDDCTLHPNAELALLVNAINLIVSLIPQSFGNSFSTSLLYLHVHVRKEQAVHLQLV